MALIPAESIEEIRGRVDIAELVGEFVPGMSRAGRSLKGRCPFHQERTPSFIVSPERQTFHCFGCGVGGDAFSFLMKIENLSFTEAAEKLAERAGVTIKRADEALGPEAKERLKLKEALEWAAAFYHELLLKSPEAAPARDYLAGRGVSADSLAAFRLGFAPRSGPLVPAALKKGFAKEPLVKAGLAAARPDGSLRDYFFGRVLFPIRDARGQVVGFGGRVMGEGEPKYLNSPESPVFSKGRVLYGLAEGLPAVRKERAALLMEGYMDVIAAHQHGLSHACAPLGTALTPDHAALLKRYASEAVIVFDADSAGVTAALRGAELLLSQGFSVRVATVPEGKDPDEHLKAFGVQAFRTGCLGKAVDLPEFKTELLLKGEKSPLSPQAKSSVAKAVLASIALAPEEVLKSEWVRRLAQRLGVEEEALRREMGKPHGTLPRPRRAEAAPAAAEPVSPADRKLLVLLLREPRLTALLEDGDFGSAAGRRARAALAGLGPWPAGWPARLLEALPEPDRPALSELLVLVPELETPDPEGALRRLLELARGLSRLKEIEPLIEQMGSGSRAKDAALQTEYAKLLVLTRTHTQR